jgi:hypothetical protein
MSGRGRFQIFAFFNFAPQGPPDFAPYAETIVVFVRVRCRNRLLYGRHGAIGAMLLDQVAGNLARIVMHA